MCTMLLVSSICVLFANLVLLKRKSELHPTNKIGYLTYSQSLRYTETTFVIIANLLIVEKAFLDYKSLKQSK